jgi:hypothetical protein
MLSIGMEWMPVVDTVNQLLLVNKKEIIKSVYSRCIANIFVNVCCELLWTPKKIFSFNRFFASQYTHATHSQT